MDEYSDEAFEQYKEAFMKRRVEYAQRVADQINKHYWMSYFTVDDFQFRLLLSKS